MLSVNTSSLCSTWRRTKTRAERKAVTSARCYHGTSRTSPRLHSHTSKRGQKDELRRGCDILITGGYVFILDLHFFQDVIVHNSIIAVAVCFLPGHPPAIQTLFQSVMRSTQVSLTSHRVRDSSCINHLLYSLALSVAPSNLLDVETWMPDKDVHCFARSSLPQSLYFGLRIWCDPAY